MSAIAELPIAGISAPAAADSSPDQRVVKTSYGSGVCWHLTSVAIGVLCGLSLLVLAHKYFAAKIFPPPIFQTNYELATTPNESFVPSLVAAVQGASVEVLVSAKTLSSEKLLLALKDKATHGVSVRVLLDPDPRSKSNAGVVAWLQRNGISNVYLENTANQNQFLVVDGAFVFIGSSPFSADSAANDSSTGIFVADKPLATSLRNFFFGRLGKSSLQVQ